MPRMPRTCIRPIQTKGLIIIVSIANLLKFLLMVKIHWAVLFTCGIECCHYIKEKINAGHLYPVLQKYTKFFETLQKVNVCFLLRAEVRSSSGSQEGDYLMVVVSDHPQTMSFAFPVVRFPQSKAPHLNRPL